MRLWRKFDWSIPDVDLVLKSLYEEDLDASLLEHLYYIQRIKTKLKLPLPSLMSLWGNISTYGETSLYSKLFLSKALQEIDSV